MNQLEILYDGALLTHNGVIAEVGPARRVENLANARQAIEISAAGRIVLPAFVNPDGVLAVPSPPSRVDPEDPSSSQRRPALRVLSRRVIEAGALSMASECIRLGTLSIGAHTRYAQELKDTIKILSVHGVLKDKPLRIRSILAPSSLAMGELNSKWFPAVRSRHLAAIVEFSAGSGEGHWTAQQIRVAATAAADQGFAIRIRCADLGDDSLHALAAQAGAVAWIGMPPPLDLADSDFGGVYVLPFIGPPSDDLTPGIVRQAIDHGLAIALSSSYEMEGFHSANPQFGLHVAVARYGFTCEEAIVASTYNAACSLKLSHVTGSLEPGKSADLLIMDVPDYRELPRRAGHSDVLLAMRRGSTVYRRGAVGLQARDMPAPPVS